MNLTDWMNEVIVAWVTAHPYQMLSVAAVSWLCLLAGFFLATREEEKR